ncbi:MAG: hypothetical protein ABEJ60_06270 [Halodesulfurarchaeum sp.]
MGELGIIDLFTLGATLVFAVPIGVFGVLSVGAGKPVLGLFGLAVAAGLVVVERSLWTPEDVPIDLIQSLGRRLR